ncbi:PREDICTED: nucleolar RNA helicase 2-A-like [Nanorana parkeri]|uniref:nucleolar RNA helicase 2-A-like n=1 Tax=Nanorana parkeri TaxID=125878 RepID=UPI000853F53B|nr:PREDICTED: nucleolar RNA helicase 2-A-like [Nanorana parkeri]
MPGILLSEEMESGVGKNKKVSKTPTPKKIKRKIQNGDTEELDFEQATELNGLVTEDSNNNDQTPKLKKKKKKLAEKESSPEAAEQLSEEQDISDAPTLKKVKKKKQKKDQEEEPEAQQEAAEPEPEIDEEKKNSKKAKENVNSDDSDAPAAKKRKTEPEVNGLNEESKEEDEEINLEKIAGDFSKFPISEETITNLKAKGVNYLFPIQSKTFHTAFSGKDVVVQARTGTGKTFSFAIPLIEKLLEDKQPLAQGRPPRVLILTPTRELAIQIMNEIRSISKKLKTCCFYGGSPYQPQVFALKTGIDLLVGTPGRIRDLIQNYKLNLTVLKHVVLDEVDMMLEMGFAEQVEEILSVRYKADPSQNPQTLLFSATCPDWMYKVAKKYMKNEYAKIDLVGHRSQRAATTVEHLAIECNRYQKAAALGDIIQVYSGSHGKTIVFCDSKLEAHELSTNCGSLKQSAKALHGDLQQKEREVILKGFRSGSFEVLIATNVAARGLDIPEVDLVVLFSAPREADAYVHRSGRTGRAGRTGICISLYEPRDRHYLPIVERSTGITFRRVGIPSILNVAQSSSADAIKSLDSIPVDVVEHFKVYAEELIEKKGALNALAAALAHISGASSLKQRSLLNMETGYITVVLKTSVPIHTLSYVWRAIKEQMGEDIDSQIYRMCLLKDSMGVCFDVEEVTLKNFQDSWKDSRRWQLSVATELPAIHESRRDDGPRGRGGRGGGGGRGGRSFDRRRNNQRGGNRDGGRNRRGGGRRN